MTVAIKTVETTTTETSRNSVRNQYLATIIGKFEINSSLSLWRVFIRKSICVYTDKVWRVPKCMQVGKILVTTTVSTTLCVCAYVKKTRNV